MPAGFQVAVILALLAATSVLMVPGCGDEDVTGPEDCGLPPPTDVDFRAEMRSLVKEISDHARTTTPDFLVITQNGLPLLTVNREAGGPFVADYLAAISGVGQENLFYGLAGDDVPTDPDRCDAMIGYLDRVATAGKPVLATSYCRDHGNMDDAYARSAARGYPAFAAPQRDLSVIPDYPGSPHRVHIGDVVRLEDARNYLLLTDPGSFADREGYLSRLAATDHDALILDAFHGEAMLTPAEIEVLRNKQNGGRRLVLARLPIDVAETDRDYWQGDWYDDPPPWLEGPIADAPGAFEVRYWTAGWRAIILGQSGAYLDRIVATGFDGIYLVGMEAYETFEDRFG